MDTTPDLTASELWHAEAFETFPAVVAHEYWRLHELLSEGQIYGALLQTKDLFEVILKLPVLACAAWLYRKDRDAAENKLLVDLLKEPLSLGTWESLGRRMLNQVELPAAAGTIEKHLSDVLALFSKYGLVKWRNDVIGHGALSLNEAHDLERDIAALLRAAQVFFHAQEGFYRSLEMRLEGAVHESAILRGVARARLGAGGSGSGKAGVAAGVAAGKAAVSLRSGDFTVDLYPFVFLSRGDIFFFDSFLYRKEKSCVISYPPGFRRNEDLAEVTELARTVDLATAMASVQGGFGGATYLSENDAVIQSLFAVEDFRRPDHLVDWLSAALKAHPKGVFHLSMEMGMGKSTFARALDPTRCGSDMAIPLKNATVRGYYLNDSYLSTAEAFCNSVTDIFNRDRDGAPLFQSSTVALPRLQPGSERPAQELAELLHFYRDAYERHYGSSRLLFVVDGLEEIPAGQARSVLDFLPRPEELADGVYILITSRLAEELPAHFRGAAALREATEAVVVSRRHEGYQAILRDYIRKNILEGLASAEALDMDTLVEKAESRFLYVRLYRDLLRSYGGERPETLPDGNELLERYLDRLKRLYGDKFHRKVTGLLAILASAYEPLTLQEIAYLSGREEVDFLMLAYMADLRAFFKIERSYRGNLVSLHAEWKAAGKRLLAENIHALVEYWIGECASLSADTLDAGNEGMTYLLSRLTEYAAEYKVDEAWLDVWFADYLWFMSNRIDEKFRATHDVERQLRMLDSAVEIYADPAAEGTDVEESLASLYVNRGSVLNDTLNPVAAIADLDLALEIRRRLDAEGRLSDPEAIPGTLLNRGNIFLKLQQPGKAIADYDAALELFERLDGESRLSDRNNLARVHRQRGVALSNMGRPERAIADFDSALEIRQRLDADGRLPDQNDLANVYVERGVAYMDIQNQESAIADYDRALAIRTKLVADGRLTDEDLVASCYLSRGYAFSKREMPMEAIADYGRALEIRERLDAEGKLLDKSNLSLVYNNRGTAFYDLHDQKRAIADYTRALEIQETLDTSGRLLDRDSLACTYLNLGNLFQEQQELDRAISEYDRALEVRLQLEAEGQLLDKSVLASVYQNRGIILNRQKKFQEAIGDLDRAAAILEGLDAEGCLLDRNQLATLYLNRGGAYLDMQQAASALEDYERAVEITLAVQREGRLLAPYHLAQVYLGRSRTLVEMKDFERALADNDRAFEIMRVLDAEGHLLNRESLARAHSNRAMIFAGQGNAEHELEEYGKALEVLELLEAEGRPYDRNALAGLYMNRGIYFSSSARSENAVADYGRAVEIRERMDAEGSLHDRKALVDSYLKRSEALLSLERLREAEADLLRANEIVPDSADLKLADFHARTGNADKAFRYLEQSRTSPEKVLRGELVGDENLASLHGDPRWADLLLEWENAPSSDTRTNAATHTELAAKLLRDAATFFRRVGEENFDLKADMDDNADVYDQVADLLLLDPDGEIDMDESDETQDE